MQISNKVYNKKQYEQVCCPIIYEIYERVQVHVYLCTLGWVDFLQKHASYCGNLGMTHKDEKWQK